MRKVFAFVFLLFPLSGWGQNVVFNPGFDMTPWDTGWTTETDTAFNSNCEWKVAVAQAIPDTGKSPPNCCRLRSYVELSPGSSNYCGGIAYAETKVYQIFNEIPSCSVKAQIKYFWVTYPSTCSWTDTVSVDVRINGVWQTIWGKRPSSHEGGDTIWSQLSVGVNNSITGIMFLAKSWIDCISLGTNALESFYFWVDDVYVEQLGIEEKEFRVKSGELKVSLNPFVQFTEVRGQKSEDRIEIYDMTGRLVEDTQSNIIGMNLAAGFYFLRIKGYKPIKIIKLGGAK